MVESYCVKQRKMTQNLPKSEQIVKTKNNRYMLKAICSECGYKKSSFIKNPNKLAGGAVYKYINLD